MAHGIKTSEIKNNLKQCKYFNYLEDDSIWLDEKRLKTWAEFKSSALKLRIRKRVKYIVLKDLEALLL